MTEEIVDVEAVEVGQELEVRAPQALNLFNASDPGDVLRRATDTAKPLAEVIKRQKLHKRIGDKEHVLVEGWTLLGSMLGVFPVTVWTKQVEAGWEARVEARTLAGAVVGAAEAMCLRSEALWRNRDEYAIRSMAQTRATSKALRQPLGFIVQLAGFQPEPAEEAERTAKPAKKKPAPETEHKTSPLKVPAAIQKEADELAAKLTALVEELGATGSLPAIEEHRVLVDITWLKRQVATAEKHVGRAAE